MPLPLFVMNLQDEGIHRKAEESLAAALKEWRDQNPGGEVTLIGHSAGCGVILGSLRRSAAQLDVKEVILIAPSVSPVYDLAGALRQVKGCLHNFHSDEDSVWLGWRCSRFGSYDSIRSAAAGKIGFHLAELDESLCNKVVQHPWKSQWKDLGNEGGHWGALSRQFTLQVIAPLLNGDGVFSPAAQK
jgi:pimeloyl-ACP methyl ester carboxylesterase